MPSIAKRVLRSSAQLLIIRFLNRSIGLISTLILARLLTPSDFGLVAIVAIIVQLFDVVATSGSSQYIIQKSTVDEKDLNTSWTIDIIMKTSLQLLLILIAPLVSVYYNKPELTMAIIVASFSLPISSFVNPGIILYKKDLEYSKILKLSVLQKLISFTTVMIIVFSTPSYWALIAGDLVSALALTVGSYIIHSYRPKWTLSEIREQWKFSQWILFKSIFGYTRSQIDTVLVSKNFEISDVGLYHVTKHLTSITARDLISPALTPLLAAFSETKVSDAGQLPMQVRLALLSLVFLVSPLSIFIWSFPQPIINTLLGSQWDGAAPVLSALSLLILSFSVNQLLELFCVSQGFVKQLFFYDLLSMAVVVSVLFVSPGDTLAEFSLKRGGLGIIVCGAFLIYVNYRFKLTLTKLFPLIIPIVLSILLTTFITSWLSMYSPNVPFLKLAFLGIIFFSSYLTISIFLYLLIFRNNADIITIFKALSPIIFKIKNRLFSFLRKHISRKRL